MALLQKSFMVSGITYSTLIYLFYFLIFIFTFILRVCMHGWKIHNKINNMHQENRYRMDFYFMPNLILATYVNSNEMRATEGN